MSDLDIYLPKPDPAPESIWLHSACGDFRCGELECTTWCEDCVDAGDVKYVRADLAEKLKARVAELEESLRYKQGVLDTAAAIGSRAVGITRTDTCEKCGHTVRLRLDGDTIYIEDPCEHMVAR